MIHLRRAHTRAAAIPSNTDKSNSPTEQRKPRFQLCFSSTITAYESSIRRAMDKLNGISAPIITPKFYTMHNSKLSEEEENEIETFLKNLKKVRELGPREKYSEPILESHRYGWYQEKLVERNEELDRVHFPKKTSEMVKIQNLLYNTRRQ